MAESSEQIRFPDDEDFLWILALLREHLNRPWKEMTKLEKEEYKVKLNKFEDLKRQIDNFIIAVCLHFTTDANAVLVASKNIKHKLIAITYRAANSRSPFTYWLLASSWRRKSPKFWIYKRLRRQLTQDGDGYVAHWHLLGEEWMKTLVEVGKKQSEPDIGRDRCWMWKGKLPKRTRFPVACKRGCEFLLMYDLKLPVKEISEWLKISKGSVSDHHADCQGARFDARVKKAQADNQK